MRIRSGRGCVEARWQSRDGRGDVRARPSLTVVSGPLRLAASRRFALSSSTSFCNSCGIASPPSSRALRTLDFGLSDSFKHPRVSPPHDFRHAREIVLAFDRLDLEPPIIRAVGPAVLKAHQRRHGERAADVRDVEALDALRRRGQAQHLRPVRPGLVPDQAPAAACTARARTFSVLASCARRSREQVAQARPPSRSPARRRPSSSPFELLLHLLALAVEKLARGLHLLEVLLARHVADARRGAVFEMRVEAMLVVAPRSA